MILFLCVLLLLIFVLPGCYQLDIMPMLWIAVQDCQPYDGLGCISVYEEFLSMALRGGGILVSDHLRHGVVLFLLIDLKEGGV